MVAYRTCRTECMIVLDSFLCPYWRRWHANGSHSTRCRLICVLSCFTGEVNTHHKGPKINEMYYIAWSLCRRVCWNMFSSTAGWVVQLVSLDPSKANIMEKQLNNNNNKKKDFMQNHLVFIEISFYHFNARAYEENQFPFNIWTKSK